MATVSSPVLPLKSVKWTFKRGDNLLASGWTGKAVVAADPWSGKFVASVTLATVQGDATVRALKSWIARLKGSTQTFRLMATAGPQNANAGVTVTSNVAQGATSLSLSGAATPLTDGQLLTVNDQLLICTADQSGSTVSFLPPLRQAAAAGTTVVTSHPYCLVYMASSKNGWSIDKDQLFGIGFDVEEAIDEGTALALPDTSAMLREDGFHIIREDGGFILRE